jgi:DNA-binding HxlR family transcriptional regulator
MQNHFIGTYQKRGKSIWEMKRALPTISERMLAKQLDELEADGILSRTVFAEVPPRVEYALTEYGETIYPIVKEIRKWGRIHQEKTLQNR